MKEGLPQDTVQTICQTQDGFLWLGTEEGLVRFDGINFEVFSVGNTEQLQSNDIIVLHEDSQGRLWIGTYGGGLTCYMDNKFLVYKKDDGLSSNVILSIYEGPSGILWIGTKNGMCRFHRNKFDVALETKDLPNNTVMAVYEDKSKNLWIGTMEGGLTVPVENQFPVKGKEQPWLEGKAIRSIHENHEGKILVGTEKQGLYFMEMNQPRNLESHQILNGKSVLAILGDKHQNIWLGTFGDGLIYYSEGDLIPVPIKKDTSLRIRTIYEDREGNLWVGTRGEGLIRIKSGQVRTYTQTHGLRNDFIRSVCQNKSGQIFVGTSQGLYSFKDDAFIPFANPLFSDKVILSLLVDDLNTLWVATGTHGIFKIKGGLLQERIQHDFFASHGIVNFYLDQTNTLWIGTSEMGLYQYKGGQFQKYMTQDGLYGNTIFSISQDKKGNLWIGTSNGLNCVKDGKIIPYMGDDLLSKEIVFSTYHDSDDNFWIGTYSSGLLRLEGNRIFSYSTRDGLASESVYSILEDDHGFFWMSSRSGIFRLKKEDIFAYDSGAIQRIPTRIYDESEGMITRECSGNFGSPVSHKSADGRLWFATFKGVCVVDPDHLSINPAPPIVRIESLLADAKVISMAEPVRIPSRTKNLEIKFKAISLTDPQKITYKRRLNNYDQDWEYSNAKESTSISLAMPPPGTYQFAITAANSDNIWSEKEVTLNFQVAPPFFRTTWFYILSVLILGFAATALIGYRKWKSRIKELKKYSSSTLADDKADKYLDKLIALVEGEQYFTRTDLSLSLLAQELSLPPSHLSQIINRKLEKNFNDFVNTYRIEDAKKRLLDPKFEHLKVTSIGSDVGFKSKSAFYLAFKKQTGMTPSDFRSAHRN